MSDLSAAEEIIERQIVRLRRSLLRSGAATVEGVRRDHQPGSELRYELLVVATPGWVTAPAVPSGHKSKARGRVSDDANVANLHRIMEPWQRMTVLAAGSVAEVVRCDLAQDKTARGLPPEFRVQIVVRVPNAAHVGLTRTTRAVPEGVAGLPGVDHVQSAVNGEA
jgi:hypothetical protein